MAPALRPRPGPGPLGSVPPPTPAPSLRLPSRAARRETPADDPLPHRTGEAGTRPAPAPGALDFPRAGGGGGALRGRPSLDPFFVFRVFPRVRAPPSALACAPPSPTPTLTHPRAPRPIPSRRTGGRRRGGRRRGLSPFVPPATTVVPNPRGRAPRAVGRRRVAGGRAGWVRGPEGSPATEASGGPTPLTTPGPTVPTRSFGCAAAQLGLAPCGT